MEDKDPYACTCDEEEVGEHGCPFQEDVHGDYDYTCTCCEGCEYNCAMDI